MKNNRIAVMASGKGSNLEIILDEIRNGRCPAQVDLVICNKEDAGALRIAKTAGVPNVAFMNPKDFSDRESFDAACADMIHEAACDWIVLAGYMRILSSSFIQRFPNKIVNIHPSLLPAFVGGDAVGDALKHGVKVAGCTVHLVSEDLDSGPILAQATVPVLDDDDWKSLHQRIQVQEHQLYPATISRLITKGFKLEGRIAIWR